MLKNRRMISLFTAMIFGVFPFLFAGTSVHAAGVTDADPSQEYVEEMAEELEYILAEIIVENPETGQYAIDENGLNASSYTQSEKENLISFAELLNDPTIIEEPAVPEGMMTTQSNKFTRCLADAANIGKAAVNEVMAHVRKGNLLAAASALLAARSLAGLGKPITIAAAVGFITFCGPLPVS